MSEADYTAALKKGKQEYRTCLAKGLYPYLSALDTILDSESSSGTADLGVVQIPAQFIVGTKTAGRARAFARNFMPLLDKKSEFGIKWTHLSDAHLEEGIREPIKAYEYMNRYYVEEGNKRVSVLKHFGAVFVPGHVIRILPKDDGSEVLARYFEMVRFIRLSGINFVEFSKAGSYTELCRRIRVKEDEPWSPEDRSRFTAMFFSFQRFFDQTELEGKGLTVSDAFLTWIRIYEYAELHAMSDAQRKFTVERVREEFTLQKENEPAEILTDPEEEKKQGIISRVFSGGEKVIHAAFIHDKDSDTSGWTYGHELGRNHAQEQLGALLDSHSVFHAMDSDPLFVIEEEIKKGSRVIFTTSPRLLPASLRAAVDHPEALILNCSLNTSHRYVRTYYARMYEAKFIIGAIAGAMAGSDPVGYVCDYPIYGQVAGINAFALGVQMVNPTCKVVLEWSSVGNPGDALKRLKKRGIRLVSSQDMKAVNASRRTSFGLSLHTDKGEIHLASPVWHWGNYYEGLLRRIQKGMIQEDYAETERAINYYWGMSADVVQVICSDDVPEGTRKLADILKEAIIGGSCNPFREPLRMQDGAVLDTPDHFLPLEDIITMDWLAENVEGSIPAYEDLNETGRSTVDQVGIDLVRRTRGEQ